jgi:citrate lyase beta subunit
MMETPRGCLNALAIAEAPGMAGFVMGTNDLAKELGARFRADRLPMIAALGTCLMAARAAGIPASTASTTPSGTRRGCGPNACRGATWAWTARR